MAKPIGSLGTIDTLTVGGRVFTDLANLTILYARVNSAGNITTGRKANGTAGYQVTAGKTLTIYAGKFFTIVTGTGALVTPLYGDTDVGIDSATPPTNPIYLAGDGGNTKLGTTIISSTTQDTYILDFDFQVPATKYFATLINVNTSYTSWYGYEA